MFILGFFIGLLVSSLRVEQIYTCGHFADYIPNNKFNKIIVDNFKLLNDVICPLKSKLV